MPKLVAMVVCSEDRSKRRACGSFMAATSIGAIAYHQLTRFCAMDCRTVNASMRLSSTTVAPV
ncbi:hypothetical protein D9M68_868690 [compost metagenome]